MVAALVATIASPKDSDDLSVGLLRQPRVAIEDHDLRPPIVVELAHGDVGCAMHREGPIGSSWKPAFLAAPDEEIPTLDLVAVTAREGNTAEAVRLLQTDVCNRTDDPDLLPGDLPERTQRILDRHGWLEDRKEAV